MCSFSNVICSLVKSSFSCNVFKLAEMSDPPSQEELQEATLQEMSDPPSQEESEEDMETFNVPDTTDKPVICPKAGCNLDLTEHTQHNRDVHIKWCGYTKTKVPEVKKRPSKQAAVFSNYFIKKPKSAKNDNNEVFTDTVDSVDTVETDTVDSSSQQFTAISSPPKATPTSPDRVVLDEEDLTVISDEDESNDRGYCAGITPTVMQDDVFNLFPFQLLPDLKVVVFSDHAIHHIECKKRNYVLPEGSDVTNSLCSELLNLAPVQNIIQRSTLKFDDMKDYNNKYFNHKQLSDKSNHYYSELNRSRLEVMRLRSRINKVGETVSMHQRFLLQIANNMSQG